MSVREPPSSASEALAAAGHHARAALSESVAAIHALLDAVSLASVGESSDANQLLGPIANVLQNVRTQLGDDLDATHLLSAVAVALDAEIERWQDRARNDPDARSVLRAFMGLREVLWEFGVRRVDPQNGRNHSPSSRQTVKKTTPKPRKSVQRINVEG